MTEENLNQNSQLAFLDEEKKAKRKYIIKNNLFVFFFCFIVGFFLMVNSNPFGLNAGTNQMMGLTSLAFLAVCTIQIIILIITGLLSVFRKDFYKAKAYFATLLWIILPFAIFFLALLIAIRFEVINS